MFHSQMTKQENDKNFKGICGADYLPILSCIPVWFEFSLLNALVYTPV